MATIKDVAKAANVSIGTVSSVLNGKKTVKPENLRKVKRAIAKLQYQPNLTARALKTGESNSIGLIIPDITNPYYPELAKGVDSAARKAGFTVFLSNSDRQIEKEEEILEAFLNKNVDGVILVKPRTPRERLLMLQKQCNLVLVDTMADAQESFDAVNVDNEEGANRIMELLFAHNHKKIAYIGGGKETVSALSRLEAYKKNLAQRGFPIEKKWIFQGSYKWEGGYDSTMKLLGLSERPTAIFAATDHIAMGVLKALNEKKINVPDEISVVGFDDIGQAQYSCPALTTVHQPKFEVGTKAFELLLERIRNPIAEHEKRRLIELATYVVKRETVGFAKR